MTTAIPAPPGMATAHDDGRWAANVRRFYLYRFFTEFQLWYPIWVLYLQEERGLSLTLIAALDAPFWLVVALAEIPTGAVADRWGRRVSMLLGTSFFVVAITIFGLADTYPLLLLSYLAWAFSITLVSGADSSFLYESLAACGRAGEFRKIFGRASAIGISAGLAASLIGAPLAARTSLATPILLSAGLGLVTIAIVFRFREPPREQHGEAMPYLTIMRTAARYAIHHAELRWMLAYRASLMGAALVAMIFTQPFLADRGVAVGDFGFVQGAFRLGSVAGALFAYRAALRLGERRVYVALALAFLSGFLLLAALPGTAAIGGLALISFANASVTPLTGDAVNRHSPADLRATLMSVSNMAFAFVLLLAEPLMGWLADGTSLAVVWGVMAAAVVVAGMGSLAAWLRAERRAAG